MFVSVIIPTYKPECYIYDCLESLSVQTLDKTLFEVLVVLNGCKDPFYESIKRYVNDKNMTNVHVIQTNSKGVSNARNLGLSKSIGDFIVFIDDDDWVSPNYLYNLVQLVEDNKTIVSTNVLQIDDASGDVLPHFLTQAYLRCLKLDKFTYFNYRSFLSTVWGKIIPKAVIGSSMFDTNYKLGEDSLFIFQISRNIKKMKITSSDTVYYVRKRVDSVSHKTYSYWYRVKVAFCLTYSYVKCFVRHPLEYDFLFFLTRVAATLRKLFQKKYE